MTDQAHPPAALLAEAEAQKRAEIDEALAHVAELRARPILAPHEQELVFRSDHPRWSKLVECLRSPPAVFGAAIRLIPYPNKASWAWRVETGQWEYYVSYEDVYRAFED